MIYYIAAAVLGLPLADKFEAYKLEFGKTYATVEAEKAAYDAFTSNDAIIESTNAKHLSYTLGHNEYSDMTWEKFSNTVMSELYLNTPPKNSQRVHLGAPVGFAVNSSVDWVDRGAVTNVKNQGQCGSCWAFSTTGSVEGAYAIATGNLVSFSEEDLVQCDKKKDNGCKGGLMDNAFMFIEQNGLAAEADYPYTSGTGITGICDKAKEAKPVVTLTSYRDVPHGDEDALKSAVAQGPVSIAIEADKSAFQLYKGGVLDNPACGQKLDHGVLVVGYGTDASLGKDYWKVKNSWGPTWGEEGFIRMVRGKNQCGLANQASYPKGVKKAAPTPPSPPGPGPSPPGPSPPGPTPTSGHYHDPKDGCQSDEVELSISGVMGDFCAPKCSLFKPCPTDVPTGVTAKPQCALQEATDPSKKFCALICAPTLPILDQRAADAQCGSNASCKSVGIGVGVCTYDD